MAGPQVAAAQEMAQRFVTLIMADERETAADELAAIGGLHPVEMMQVALQLADLVVLVNVQCAAATGVDPQVSWQQITALLAAWREGVT